MKKIFEEMKVGDKADVFCKYMIYNGISHETKIGKMILERKTEKTILVVEKPEGYGGKERFLSAHHSSAFKMCTTREEFIEHEIELAKSRIKEAELNLKTRKGDLKGGEGKRK